VHITCGVALQAAVSDSGELLLWGDKQCMPVSMLGQAQMLGAAAPHQAAASTDPCTAQAYGVSAAQEAARTTCSVAVTDDQLTSSCATKVDGRMQPVLQAQLMVQPSGCVKLVLTCVNTGRSAASANAKGSAVPISPLPQQQQLQKQRQQKQQQKQEHGQGTDQGFSPQEEPIADLASGASHQVVLCQPSQHIPNQGEL
jgi:hypothetical protein